MAIQIDGDSGISGVNGSATTPALQGTDSNTGIVFGTDQVQIATGGSTRATVDSSGHLGLGTTSPTDTGGYGRALDIQSDSGAAIYLRTNDDTSQIAQGASDLTIRTRQAHPIIFNTDNSERARLDSSGRLLVGTTTARTDFYSGALDADIQLEDSSFCAYSAYATNGNGAFIFGRGNPISGSTVGNLSWMADDGTDEVETARISGQIDGTPSSNVMPGRLVFFTTADGASSVTERGRFNRNGHFLVGQTNASFASQGHILAAGGQAYHIIPNNPVLLLNRQSSDGEIVRISQDGNTEGTISVSGSTVSYNGGHLARWSQLASGTARTEILRGSVLSNLDEMCEWAHAAQDAVLYTAEDELPEGASVGDVKTPAVDAYTEDNEQLNRMKVSDVEGDPNVAGVFQAWDDDDDTYDNDFYCAMTGDFIIRIAQGTTVARGDLLMSAGDGTAKPQDDDIVRSKTIAKVTSTTVSTTYSDGSYCVPCVLMAC